MILAHIAIKSFDLVSAMTAGGPGYSSDLPAMFMYLYFQPWAIPGSASAIMMLAFWPFSCRIYPSYVQTPWIIQRFTFSQAIPYAALILRWLLNYFVFHM